MHQNSQTHFKRVQSLKFLNIAKQKQPQAFSNFFNPAFLTIIYKHLNRSPSAVFLNDKIINQQRFADLFSEYYQPNLCSYDDMVEFYNKIKDVFNDQCQSKNEITLLNKSIFLSKFDQQSENNYVYQILTIRQEILTSQSFQSYKEMIIKFNYCLMSLYYLQKDQFLTNFYEICQMFTQKDFIEVILKEISQKKYEQQSYKSLLFVSDACLSYSEIEKLFTQSRFFEKDYWNIFKESLQRFASDESSNANVALLAFLNVFMRLKSEFVQFMLMHLSEDNKGSVLLNKSLNIIDSTAYTQQVIEFYSYLLHCNFNRYQYIRQEMVIEIQLYAVKVLGNNQPELFCAALKLINETIKYNVENSEVLLIFKALESNSLQLTQSALLALETAFKVENREIIQTFLIKRAKYIPILFNQLSLPFKEGFSSNHSLCLQIIHLMIRPDFLLCINDLLSCLFVALQTNIYFSTFISEILKKLCQLILSNEYQAKVVSAQLILRITLTLLSASICEDSCLFVLQSDFKFINKQIIKNTIQSMICFFQSQHMNKQIQSNNANGRLLFEIYNNFEIILKSYTTETAIIPLLRQQITSYAKNIHKKVYGSIFAICENIIFTFRAAQTEWKKNIQQKRRKMLAFYYDLLTLQELKIEKIPILIEYNIHFKLFREHELQRILPVFINYQSFQRYCLEIMQPIIQSERYQAQIPSICFKDLIYSNFEVRDETSYRNMIDRCLNDRKRQYKISVFIQPDNSLLNLNSNQFLPSSSISTFNTVSSYQSIRLSPRETQSIGNRSRSPSPYHQTISRMVPTQVSICQKCRRPSPHILCEMCNRR